MLECGDVVAVVASWGIGSRVAGTVKCFVTISHMSIVLSHASVCEVSRHQVLACKPRRVRIDHDAADFPFEQLAVQLRERITSGEYAAGQKLPTINEIVSETGLSPMTIRRAVKTLADEGLVRVVPGRGTFVAER